MWTHTWLMYSLSLSLVVTSPKVVAPDPAPELPAVLAAIAQCESGGRQFNPDGSVILGRVNPADVGKYQINTEPRNGHLARALALGLDLWTEEGNEAYALDLYQRQGTTPWNWSRSCWLKNATRGAGQSKSTSTRTGA